MKPYDKLELSPNSSALCHNCHREIHKNELRVGIHHWYIGHDYHNAHPPHWVPWYYHHRCCTKKQLDELDIKENTIVGKKHHQKHLLTTSDHDKIEEEIRCKRQKLIYETRGLLRQELQTLRTTLANASRKPFHKILQDVTLDSIVENMPSTVAELMECYGIGYWTASLYAGPILEVLNQYRKMHRVLCDYDDSGDVKEKQQNDNIKEAEETSTSNTITTNDEKKVGIEHKMTEIQVVCSSTKQPFDDGASTKVTSSCTTTSNDSSERTNDHITGTSSIRTIDAERHLENRSEITIGGHGVPTSEMRDIYEIYDAPIH
jgi:ribonuclease D